MPRFTIRDEVADIVTDAQTAAAGTMTSTFAAIPGRRNFIQGLTITGLGATAASTIEVTVAGPPTTMKFKLTIPAGATVALTPLSLLFGDGIAASADNTAITVSVPSFGTGNTQACVSTWGFRA